MALDPKIIKESFENVKPIAMEVITYFYDFMFEKYPEAKPLFASVDMEKQKLALINSLVYVVTNLEDGDKLSSYLKGLGSRHVNYGVVEAHYAIVGDCLLSTFAHFFKDGWTPELKSQWTEAYGVIQGFMLEGAGTHKVS